MAVKQLGDLFDHGIDILGTSQDAKGTILAQTGDAMAEEVASNDVEVYGPSGLASRPAKAIAGKSACQAITLSRGSNDIIIGMRDLRGSSLYGTLREGETCLYAPGPSNKGTGRIVLQDDGSAQTITIQVNGTTKIVVKSDGSIAISGGPVNIAGASDFAALAAKVDSNLSTLSAAVSAATCPPGTAGGPLVFVPPSLPSVAASQVKIS